MPLPQLFRLLVHVDTDGKPSRRRVDSAEWAADEAFRQLVDHLVTARLLHTSDRQGRPALELAHEVLLEAWQPLKQWLNENRTLLSVSTDLVHATERWERGGRDTGDLLGGRRLAQSVDLISHRPDMIGADVQHFVKTSRARSETDNQLRERWISDKVRASEQQRASGDGVEALRSALQAAEAASSNASDPDKLLASDAQASLYQALSYVYPRLVYHARDEGTLRGRQATTEHSHTRPVRAVALSSDGGRLATGADDGTIRVWEAVSGERLHAFSVHKMAVNAVSIDPHGQLLSASEDRTAMVLSLADRQPCGTLIGHGRGVTCGVFDPRGSQVATASDDGTVRLWKIPSGEPIRSLTHGGAPIVSIAISGDGTELMSASSDGSVRTWNLDSKISDAHVDQGQIKGGRFGRSRRLIAANIELLLALLFVFFISGETSFAYWFTANDVFLRLAEKVLMVRFAALQRPGR
jgi:hypothetical protein